MKLWIGNIAPGTSDDEIKELVKKYAPDMSRTSIQRVEGTGSRPGATLEFTGGGFGAIVVVPYAMWRRRVAAVAS
jgi:hypothetical protein